MFTEYKFIICCNCSLYFTVIELEHCKRDAFNSSTPVRNLIFGCIFNELLVLIFTRIGQHNIPIVRFRLPRWDPWGNRQWTTRHRKSQWICNSVGVGCYIWYSEVGTAGQTGSRTELYVCSHSVVLYCGRSLSQYYTNAAQHIHIGADFMGPKGIIMSPV